MAQPGADFGGLLRELRAEAQLTQEELAEVAGVSQRAVSDLERGINRTARKDTALLLAGALDLDGEVRELFVAAARGRGDPAAVLAARQGAAVGAFATAAIRALPRDIATFTGRRAELSQLMATLGTAAVSGGVVGIHAIDGMAGIGKTTFAVHAAHQLTSGFPGGQFFLQLHAHTAGQQPVDPADALASLLLTAGVAAPQIPPGLEARAGRWRDYAAGKKILLLLDDAAGHEQVKPLLPGTAGSLVLITSRRRLTALADATVISLDVLPAADAAALLARLARRPDIGGPAMEITRLCGYLPLAIGMLAGQLRHHPAWTGIELAAALAAASDRLAVMRAENLSVAAAFGLSYADLSADQQRLFRRLGLVPGRSFDAYAAAAADKTSLDTATRRLEELYDHHLLTEPAPGRYRLHDLLREHARALAAADEDADRDAATTRLLDYYLQIALTAGRHYASRPASQDWLPPGRRPAWAPDLPTPQAAAAWLETERMNLQASVDHAASHGYLFHAVQIPAAIRGFLGACGYLDQSAALHQAALAAARQAGDRPGAAAALAELGSLRMSSGGYATATALLAEAAELHQTLNDDHGHAEVLANIGLLRALAGDCRVAAASHQQALALARACDDRLGEANALNSLGVVQRLTGDSAAAAASQRQALALYCDLGEELGQASALNELGVVQRETGDYAGAAASQRTALALFRSMGGRLGQAWALNDLALVQQLTGDYDSAAAGHDQALTLFREIGHQFGQAEALNRLGWLAIRTADPRQARNRHTRALAIARDIGAPLQQARALEGIGHSHLNDGHPVMGLDCLRQALTIYQRIGAPEARRVKETLHRHEPASIAAELRPPAPGGEECSLPPGNCPMTDK